MAPEVVEICCGSAGLCAAFRAIGIPALGIDWGMNRHVQKAPWVSINMAEQSGMEQALEVLKGCDKLRLVWFGLPCGTASRAREAVAGPGMPPQLRSAQHPEGLPGLRESDAKKVQAANAIYGNAVKIIEWCRVAGVTWCIENPANSYLWYLPAVIALLNDGYAEDIEYSACMVGSGRDKKQRLRTCSPTLFKELRGLQCDRSHKHDPWSSGAREWHSAEEAEYPKEFCEMIANSCRTQARKCVVPSGSAAHARGAMAAAKRPRKKGDMNLRRAVGVQPGSTRTARLIPEYKLVMALKITDEEYKVIKEAKTKNKGWVKEPIVLLAGHIPAGTRILRRKGEDQRGSSPGRDEGSGEVQYGTPWEPDEFIVAAKEVKHPFDEAAYVADRLKLAVFKTLTSGIEHTLTGCRSALEYWKKRAAELHDEEMELFAAASPLVQPCWGNAPSAQEALSGQWRGKRTLLFNEMAKAAGVKCADMITAYMQKGVPVFGEVPPTGLYAKEFSPPDKTFMQVLQAAKWSKPVLRAKVRGDPDPAVDDEVLERTEQEVKEGKAEGPYTEQEVDAIFGKHWAPARRVGLVQTAGVRPIDDFSEFGHNGTSETHEKVDLATVDVCAGIIKQYHDAVKAGGWVSVKMQNGELCVGRLHGDYQEPERRRLKGRTVDLKRAFKQLATAPSMAPLTVVGVWHRQLGGVRYYLLKALPFGARNAVFTFGATARALECILVGLFSVMTAQYVDDFPQVEPAECLKDGEDIMVEVLELLGWQIKKESGEAPKFEDKFTMLGVVMDVGHVHEGQLQVFNKPERGERICREVEQIVRSGRVMLLSLIHI